MGQRSGPRQSWRGEMGRLVGTLSWVELCAAFVMFTPFSAVPAVPARSSSRLSQRVSFELV